MFNHKRLILARKRRGLTGKGLADLAGMSAVTISRLENGENPPESDTVARLAAALRYPADFFTGDDPEELDTDTASFRSLKRMTAKERDAALAAGALGLQLNIWIEREFSLPKPNLLDLSYETDPEAAARSLRAYWGLGEKAIADVLSLLEFNGVRVFSLSEETKSVDAFSFWRGDIPFVFLNTFKSAEHSIFDSVHELGHLVLHRHAGRMHSRFAEREANQFASAFLMPKDDVRARIPRFVTVDAIVRSKKRWRVSAMALAYRLHALDLLTDWQYKSACIQLSRRGYRAGEPDGIDRETSKVWKKILAQLWTERTTKNEIASGLGLPLDEIQSLIWGLTDSTTRPDPAEGKRSLRAIK
jgi:Zn-dependent peptidase ImmA (M78 family)/DNA-binding XRE family transcriptional regulator